MYTVPKGTKKKFFNEVFFMTLSTDALRIMLETILTDMGCDFAKVQNSEEEYYTAYEITPKSMRELIAIEDSLSILENFARRYRYISEKGQENVILNEIKITIADSDD